MKIIHTDKGYLCVEAEDFVFSNKKKDAYIITDETALKATLKYFKHLNPTVIDIGEKTK